MRFLIEVERPWFKDPDETAQLMPQTFVGGLVAIFGLVIVFVIGHPVGLLIDRMLASMAGVPPVSPLLLVIAWYSGLRALARRQHRWGKQQAQERLRRAFERD